MAKKVKISLEPIHLMMIGGFVYEYMQICEGQMGEDSQLLYAIKQAAAAYESEIGRTFTEADWISCDRQNEFNQLIGDAPLSKKNMDFLNRNKKE